MILVTAATGLNGSAVIRELARQKEPVRALIYRSVTPEERDERLWWGHQGSPAFADAMDELFRERREGIESRVDLSTHEAFGIRPTTFAEFARRNAAVLRGEAGIPVNLSPIR